MRSEHLRYLVCPKTKRRLEIVGPRFCHTGRIREGVLCEPVSGNEYPIVDYIPRFVPAENYAQNFGFQWSAYSRSQYDDQLGLAFTRERFDKETKWPSDLRGEIILEVGCGSGRFTPCAVATGALVVSFDFSNAVDASFKSNGHIENLLLVQASVCEMPFPANFFDRAFCLGVLQHTPDPRASFEQIVDCLKPGGKIVSDVYPKNLSGWLLHPKYWVRPFVTKFDHRKLLKRIKKYVNAMWPVAQVVRRLPVVGHRINSRLLLPDFFFKIPAASEETLKELACLETFDMLSPVYDLPQTLKVFRHWHEELGLTDIDVHRGYNGYEGRATKSDVKRAA